MDWPNFIKNLYKRTEESSNPQHLGSGSCKTFVDSDHPGATFVEFLRCAIKDSDSFL